MIGWCWAGLVLSTVSIVYQDFKYRLISVFAIAGYGLSCVALFLITHSLQEWLENSIFCLAYFMFCYLILHLFYFLKTKRFQKIIDKKIGWGDILLFIIIGSCISPLELIYFFTASFLIALLFQILFQRKNKEIALAGLLAVCYAVFATAYQILPD